MKAYYRALAAFARRIAPAPGAWRVSGLVGSLVPHCGIEDVRLFGAPVTLDLSDDMQRAIYVGGYELAETSIVRGILTSGMTFLDIGANVGYFTALGATLVGQVGRVFSFEPYTPVFSRLQRTVSGAGHEQVQLFNMALGAQEDSMELYIPPEEEHNLNPSAYQYRSNMTTVTVRITKLDMALKGVERVDLMKVDVEGYEPFVFQGAVESLAAGKIRNVLYESNPRMLALAHKCPRELDEQLTRFGYREVARIPHEGASNMNYDYENVLMTLSL